MVVSASDLEAAREVERFKTHRRAHILIFLFACLLAYILGGGSKERAAAPATQVNRSTAEPQWLEVCHHGQVIAEFQPSDGVIYESLDDLIESIPE